MSISLVNKTILITGASKGFGLNLAQAMWQCGANLILIARDINQLTQLKTQLLSTASAQQFIELFPFDLANTQDISAFVQSIYHKVERIDVLINNAAIQGPIGLSWQNDWNEWQEALHIDLLAPVAFCRSCIPQMLKHRSGKIINLSGGGATGIRPNFSAYAVAKTGLVRFSEILAKEVETYGIDVNCIAPGVMNTAMLATILNAGPERAGDEYKTAERLQETTTNFEQATQLCLYLASSLSDGITGKLISAVWDPWSSFAEFKDKLNNSDIYTLRRIVPGDRGEHWGEKK